jgi:transcription elongation factor Elf1
MVMNTVSIKRYPTRLAVRCPQCQHQGVVSVFLDRPPKLHCSKCGDKNPIIVQRDRTRTWARQRRGR